MASTARRVLMVGLDGYDPAFGERLMGAGELPALQQLAARSARFDLDHGAARRTGLAWEHVSSGQSPDAARRWAAVHFDPATYNVWQQRTRLPPFPAALAARTVVFDAPYFDLARAPHVQGLVAWGIHDPGAPAAARPAGLERELIERFGAYPAKRWLYGFVWPSPAQTRAMAAALVQAVDARAEAACWLFRDRLPDWDLGYMVASELHAASEALWHGIDPDHPLHAHPSAEAAADGLKAVYRAIDRLVGRVAATFPDVTLVAFNLHGMGTNDSDLASMVLLPELLLRHSTGTGLLRQRPVVERSAGVIDLPDGQIWGEMIDATMTAPRPQRRRHATGLQRALQLVRQRSPWRAAEAGQADRRGLGWMPAARYASHWPSMAAFALPSYYDGRVRINLAGRERSGRVRPADYAAACDEIEQLALECRDIRTGEPVVAAVERIDGRDPLTLAETEADMQIVWRGSASGFVHPRLGRIGPLPFRRTGGHTGGNGIALVSGRGIAAGGYGTRSAFDVVPSVVELLGEAQPGWMSGRSFANELLAVPAGRR